MKRLLFIAVIVLGLIPASIATAHDPIILTSDQRTPTNGPLLVDGTISFALYGSLDTSGDTRGFRVQFNEGDPLSISILIPDLSPENMLSEDSLPVVNVEDPNGTTVKLSITQKVLFPEPYTGTNYVRLTEFRGTAIGGTYSFTVTGKSPARFTVSVGEKEMFGSPVENIPNRDLGVAGVMAWYAGDSFTGASTVPVTQTLVSTSTFTNPVIPALAAAAIIIVLGFVRFIKVRRRTS